MAKAIVESDMVAGHPNVIDNVDNGGLNNDLGFRIPILVTNIQNTRDVRHDRNS